MDHQFNFHPLKNNRYSTIFYSLMKDSTLTRPAKVSSNSHDGVNSINGVGHTRPMATEARPNPVILEDDNEASTSRENAGQYSLCNI